MEPPLSDLFSVVKIAWTALLFPLAARDAASHADDVNDRGHTDPVKNGDAFERLGIMTHLADKMNTVMVSDNFSVGDDHEMTQLHGHSVDEGALSWVGIPPMSAYTRVLCSRWNLCGATPSWFATLTLVQPEAFQQHLH